MSEFVLSVVEGDFARLAGALADGADASGFADVESSAGRAAWAVPGGRRG